MIEKTKSQQGHHAFTLHEEGILREIITDCEVSLPWHPLVNKNTPPPKLYKAMALWDTGATNSAITKDLVDKLGLVPFKIIDVHHADGVTPSNVYKVNIILPNKVGIAMVNVTQCKSTAGKFDLIIGMDIITKGDFAITNVAGKTMVSYRTPSAVSIDFNDGKTTIIPNSKDNDNEQEEIVVKNYAGTPRNAKCPCGSGKKYKQCHGK